MLSGNGLKKSFFICLLCWGNSLAAQTQQPYTEEITVRGNVFEVLTTPGDTVIMLDPVIVEEELVITPPLTVPVKVNNMHIYSKGDVGKQPDISSLAIKKMLVQAIVKQVPGIADGNYRLLLSNVILSDKGKIVYFSFGGIERKTVQTIKGEGNVLTRERWAKVYEERQTIIEKAIVNFTEKNAAYKPATANAYAVPYRLVGNDEPYSFSIKGGTVAFP